VVDLVPVPMQIPAGRLYEGPKHVIEFQKCVTDLLPFGDCRGIVEVWLGILKCGIGMGEKEFHVSPASQAAERPRSPAGAACKSTLSRTLKGGPSKGHSSLVYNCGCLHCACRRAACGVASTVIVVVMRYSPSITRPLYLSSQPRSALLSASSQPTLCDLP